MIDAAYVQRMSRYNRWQNENLYGVADRLSDHERRRDRGAFFGSIHQTLNHLLWGDRQWMSRFAGWPKPSIGIRESVSLYPDWNDLKRERTAADAAIIAWADGFDPDWTKGDLTWFSGGLNREVTRPRWQLVTHFFNHQTHHRGQVHAMLTQAGGKPHDTDLFVMPE
ncbi:MAG: DinB family protein [Pseudolabrys sp.]|nr:DinB family protein [Pseudolabrys sp.]MCW5684248.1 DinB family protein [Pseudolabrys sp.]